jgi:hypothetical protein
MLNPVIGGVSAAGSESHHCRIQAIAFKARLEIVQHNLCAQSKEAAGADAADIHDVLDELFR